MNCNTIILANLTFPTVSETGDHIVPRRRDVKRPSTQQPTIFFNLSISCSLLKPTNNK